MEIKDYHADHSKELKHMLWKKASSKNLPERRGEFSRAPGDRKLCWRWRLTENTSVLMLFSLSMAPGQSGRQERKGWVLTVRATFLWVLKPEIVSRVNARGKWGRRKVQERKKGPFLLLSGDGIFDRKWTQASAEAAGAHAHSLSVLTRGYFYKP